MRKCCAPRFLSRGVAWLRTSQQPQSVRILSLLRRLILQRHDSRPLCCAQSSSSGGSDTGRRLYACLRSGGLPGRPHQPGWSRREGSPCQIHRDSPSWPLWLGASRIAGHCSAWRLCSVSAVNDLLHLPAIHGEITSYRTLTAALCVPGLHPLFRRDHNRLRRRFDPVHRRRGLVRSYGVRLIKTGALVCPDEQHEKFEAADRDCWTLPSPFIVVCRRVRLLGVSPGHGGFGVVRY
jgi:hypothetical protein